MSLADSSWSHLGKLSKRSKRYLASRIPKILAGQASAPPARWPRSFAAPHRSQGEGRPVGSLCSAGPSVRSSAVRNAPQRHVERRSLLGQHRAALEPVRFRQAVR